MRIASNFVWALVFLFAGPGASGAVESPSPQPKTPPWTTMKYGLFIHHVYGHKAQDLTPLGPQGGYPKDMDDFIRRFDVNRFADDVKSTGAEYIIITAWHWDSNPLYPSPRMAKWRGPGHSPTSRDLLGEIIDALAARGVRTLLYINIWNGHDYGAKGESGRYAYNNPKGIPTEEQCWTGYYPAAHTGDRKVWNNYIEDILDELGSRYAGRISGIYVDGSWTGAVDKKRMMATIHRYNPDCPFIANGFPYHGLEFCSKEVAGPESKDYGFARENPAVKSKDVNTWTGSVRHVAFIAGSNWWATPGGKIHFDPDTLFRYTILQAGVCTTGGGVAWALGTYADGSWESGVMETMKQLNARLTPIAESVKNTRPSPSYPTLEKTPINKLEHGIVATRSADGRYDYLHVLRAPEGNTLTLPAPKDGRRFASGILLVSGKPVTIKQSADSLQITVPEGWDRLDTVIRLTGQ